MSNWKRILVLCLCFLMASVGVNADSLILSYDAENQAVNISLEMEGAVDRKPVTLVIIGEGSTEYAYIREYDADAEGKLQVTAGLTGDKVSGKYLASVTSGDSNMEAWFWHMNFAQASASVTKINAVKTAAAFTEELRGEADNLGIDIDYFNAKASDIATMFLNIKGNANLTPLEFWRTYYTAAVCAYSKGETKYKNIELLLKSNSSAMGIDYERLAEEQNEVKNELYSRFSKGSYTHWDIEKQYNEWLNLAVINNASTWNAYYKLISDTYSTELGLDFSKYNSSSYKQDIIKELMAENFGSYQALRDAFYQAVNRDRGKGGGGSGLGTSPQPSKQMEFAPPATQPEEVTPPPKTETFSDVPSTHWAYSPINELFEKNILSGYADGSFLPGNEVTRAEFAKMLAGAFYSGQSASANAFNDVNTGDWHFEYIALLFDKGIILGDENGNFNPSNPISRQDMAVMVLRVQGDNLKEIREYTGFSDQNEIDAYAAESVNALYAAGILNGMPDGSFMPKGRLSRAEAAKVIYELLNTGGVGQ